MNVLRRYGLFFALLVGALSWNVACSDPPADGDADADGDGDGDSDGDNILEVVGDQTKFMQFAATETLQVRYLDAQRSPIRGAQISWALAGNDGGASLLAQNSQTNDSGMAEMQLTSGSLNTNFQVTATSPTANTASFSITVSDTAVGSIVVTMTYEGEQVFTNFKPYLWQGVACNTIDPANPQDIHTLGAEVTRIVDRPRFDSVTEGNTWTVGVAAEVGGEILGWGCNQGVAVTNAQVTDVPMTIMGIDQIVRFEGVYDLENTFDFSDVLPPSVENALDLLGELTDDNDPDRSTTDDPDSVPADQCGQDPGAFIQDLIMRQTCHWECVGGEDFDDCSEINHPIGDLQLLYTENFQSWDGAQGQLPFGMIGGCGVWEFIDTSAQDLINDQLEDWVPAFITNFVLIVGDLSRAINNARIDSVFTIDAPGEMGSPFTHVLTQMHVRLHDLDGGTHDFSFNLDDVGMGSITAAETAAISGDLLTIHDHQFELHFGQLLQYIYLNGVLPLVGFDSTAEMLATWIDCQAVAETIDVFLESNFYVSPGVGMLRDLCDGGLVAGGNALEDLLVDALDVGTTLILNGNVNGYDLDANDIAQTLGSATDPGVWEGAWTEGTFSGDATGEFTGTRRP